MYSSLVMLFITLCLLVVAVTIVLILSVKFLLFTRKQKEIAVKFTKMVEEKTKKEYNKIASLPPNELNSFLAHVYPRMLSLAAETDAREGDPDNPESLYAVSVSELLKYLGDETVAAINFYYGDDYIFRWALYGYRGLLSAGIISDFIQTKTTAKDITKYL